MSTFTSGGPLPPETARDRSGQGSAVTFTLSDSAREELDAYFGDRERTPVRIYLAPGGCAGPKLALALDQSTEQDVIFDVGGHSFCINKELAATVGSLAVDFSGRGFSIDCARPPAGDGCSGCSGGCSVARDV